MIVHKLEHDLLKHLSITEQEEKKIRKQENAFTKYSEIKILEGNNGFSWLPIVTVKRNVTFT